MKSVVVLGCLALSFTPARAQMRERNWNLNVNVDGDAASCADLRVRSNGEVARAAESFTLQKSEAPTLEMTGSSSAQIQVRGWSRPEYSVEACKIAVAEDRGQAERLLQGIQVSRAAGRFRVNGSSDGSSGRWQVYFIVHAPQDASLNLETTNGPIAVREVNGRLNLHAVNGPVSIQNCSGTVDAQTTNGPISFSGSGGEVHLNAHNGPISVRVAGDNWNGSQLEARTVNGPLSVDVPNSFQSGIRLETSGHTPISCKLDACHNARTDYTSDQRTIQLNGSADTIRLSTENGPVSLHSSGKSAAIM